jgi:hypothetical protein
MPKPLPTVQPTEAMNNRATEYDRLTNPSLESSKSYIDQIADRHPWIGKPLQVASAVGGALFPGYAAMIPGTQQHHDLLVRHQAGLVNQDQNAMSEQQKRQEEAAHKSDLEAQPELKATQEENTRLHQAEQDRINQQKVSDSKANNEAKNQETHWRDLRKQGLEVDPISGQPTPIGPEAMTPIELASYTAKQAMSGLSDAKADLARAQATNDPVKLKVAQENLNVKQQQLELAQRHFEAQYYGTDNGVPIPGAPATKDNQPLGFATKALTQPTGTEINKGDLANSALMQIKTMRSIIQKHPEFFGPIAGRTGNFKQWLGTNDPEAAQFRDASTFLADHSLAVFGGRNEYMVRALKDITNPNLDVSALLKGLDQAEQTSQHFANQGTRHTVPHPSSASGNETPKVTTKAEFDALPSGTVYIGKDGQPYRKP